MKLPRMMALAVAVCWPGIALAAGEYVNPSLAAQVGNAKAARILEFLNEGKGDAPRVKTVAIPVAKPSLNPLPSITTPAAKPVVPAQAAAVEDAPPMKLASLPVPAKKPTAPKRDNSYIAFDPAKEARNAKKGPRFELSSVAPRMPKPGTVNEAKVMPVRVAALPAPVAKPERSVKTANDLPPALPVIPDNAAKKEVASKSKVEQAFDNVEPVLANATLVPVQGGSALMPPSLPVKEARAAMPDVKDVPNQQLASNAPDAEIQQLAAIAPAAGVAERDAPMQMASVAKPSMPVQVAGQFTRNVVDRSPVDRQSSAVIADGKLMFFSEVQGMGGKSLLHRWKVNGKVVEERRFPVASNEWRTWSQLWLKPNYVGTITVEMLSDGKVVGSESIEVKS